MLQAKPASGWLRALLVIFEKASNVQQHIVIGAVSPMSVRAGFLIYRSAGSRAQLLDQVVQIVFVVIKMRRDAQIPMTRRNQDPVLFQIARDL